MGSERGERRAGRDSTRREARILRSLDVQFAGAHQKDVRDKRSKRARKSGMVVDAKEFGDAKQNVVKEIPVR